METPNVVSLGRSYYDPATNSAVLDDIKNIAQPLHDYFLKEKIELALIRDNVTVADTFNQMASAPFGAAIDLTSKEWVIVKPIHSDGAGVVKITPVYKDFNGVTLIGDTKESVIDTQFYDDVDSGYVGYTMVWEAMKCDFCYLHVTEISSGNTIKIKAVAV